MKRILALALAFFLVFSIIPVANAEEVTTPADDPIILEILASGALSFSGTTAICSGSVTDNMFIPNVPIRPTPVTLQTTIHYIILIAMKMSIAHSGFFHQLINNLCFEK